MIFRARILELTRSVLVIRTQIAVLLISIGSLSKALVPGGNQRSHRIPQLHLRLNRQIDIYSKGTRITASYVTSWGEKNYE